MNIQYRHYEPGDDEQLADLFNRSFQMNGAGFVRTPKTWHWRYAQEPGFEPEQCQIAEDIEKKRIVGAIYVNLVEKIPINGKEYLVGDINDVSTHPNYTGQGISKKLMEMAIEYMEKKECDLSILMADYNGFPRKKIYLKYGYNDVNRSNAFFQIAYLPKFMKDLPILSFMFPILFTVSYIPRLLTRIRVKINKFFKNISYEIAYNQRHLEYYNALNRILPKYYTGFPGYSKNKILWARIQAPYKQNRPTFIIIRKDNKIIAGATLTYQNIHLMRFRIKIRIGIIHEIFIEKEAFKNKRNLHLGYMYLFDKIVKAANQRRIGCILFQAPSDDKDLRNGFRGINFFMIKGGVLMIKLIKKNLILPKLKKPIFIPTYVSTGVP
ncbi:MAG: GNAT family N-acetyltransferase [Promethearchaeota archaeon]